jgi:repressor LexA
MEVLIMSTFANRLKTAMENSNMKAVDLHNKTGISKSTISEYLAGSYEPKQKNIYKLATALNILPSELMGISPNPSPALAETYRIPVLGSISAGVPIEASEDIVGYEYLSEKYKGDGCTYFALRVQGRSMEPTIMDGDTVIVRQQPTVESGEIAVVLINGDSATAKEVKESPEGITLIGHNAAVYSPHPYSNKEIEELPVMILGKVIEIRRHVG